VLIHHSIGFLKLANLLANSGGSPPLPPLKSRGFEDLGGNGHRLNPDFAIQKGLVLRCCSWLLLLWISPRLLLSLPLARRRWRAIAPPSLRVFGGWAIAVS